MTVVTLSASGAADVDTAWERYAVPQLWSQWAPQITRVDASGARLTPGLTGTVVGPLGVSANFHVDSVEEHARRWAWTVSRGPLTVRLRHGVRERSGGGSTTWLAIDGPLPVALGYLPLAYLALRRLVSR
jgi:hypothetical protein